MAELKAVNFPTGVRFTHQTQRARDQNKRTKKSNLYTRNERIDGAKETRGFPAVNAINSCRGLIKEKESIGFGQVSDPDARLGGMVFFLLREKSFRDG
jgi:hypothetical protein